MRLAPTSSLADLVHTRAEANIRLPIRELMWGMPGSMLAAIHMAEMTREPRWRGLLKCRRPGCLPIWRTRRKVRSGPRISMVPTTVGSGPSTGSRQRHPVIARVALVDAGAAGAGGRARAEDPCGECVAVRSRDDMGRAQQARDAANDVPALSRCARHGDDICGCAVRCPRVRRTSPGCRPLHLGRRTTDQGLEPLPRHGWQWLRIPQAPSPHERPDLARPRTPVRHDGHRPVSGRSARRWPRTVFALDRRRRPCRISWDCITGEPRFPTIDVF